MTAYYTNITQLSGELYSRMIPGTNTYLIRVHINARCVSVLGERVHRSQLIVGNVYPSPQHISFRSYFLLLFSAYYLQRSELWERTSLLGQVVSDCSLWGLPFASRKLASTNRLSLIYCRSIPNTVLGRGKKEPTM